MTTDIKNLIEHGLNQMSVALSNQQVNTLVDYVLLLEKWNKAYNLTAVRDPIEMVGHHVLDSLSVNPHLRGLKIIDIGSGAGLPGIPLAIQNPGKEFLLLDSNSKKTRFMLQAVNLLGLSNVSVFHGRAEDYPAKAGFDTVVCRALAVLPQLILWGGHLLSDKGVLIAQKGAYPKSELDQLPEAWVAISHRVEVPLIDGKERHIVVMSRSKSEKC